MTDPIISQIAGATQATVSGDKAGARRILAELWTNPEARRRPEIACVIAHYLADTMDDPREELVWDSRALEAADAATAAGVTMIAGVGPIAAFYPSLHLNLGDVHLRLGEIEACGRHLARARQALSVLPEGETYSRLVRRGVDGLAARHAEAVSASAQG